MSYTYLRVARRTVRLSPGRDDQYDVELVLTNRGITPAGGGGTKTFPHPPTPPSIVQQVSGAGSLTMPDGPVAAGDTLVWVGNSRGGIAGVWNYAVFGYTLAVTATTAASGDDSLIVYRLADGTEGSTLTMATAGAGGTWYELPGEWTPAATTTATGAGSPVTVGPITAPTSSIVFTASAYGAGGSYDSVASTLTTTPGTGWTEDWDSATGGHPTSWTAHQFASGSVTGSSSNSAAGGAADGFGLHTTDWSAVIAAFQSAGGAFELPPAPGQYVNNEAVTPTPDGSTTTFSTRWPFADGSLRLVFDGIGVSTSSEDGAAGTFTLSWAPEAGRQLWATYQGR